MKTLIISDGSGIAAGNILNYRQRCGIDCNRTYPARAGGFKSDGIMQAFGVLTFVCINKYDINENKAVEIENYCRENDFCLAGRIPYDDLVMKSINELAHCPL